MKLKLIVLLIIFSFVVNSCKNDDTDIFKRMAEMDPDIPLGGNIEKNKAFIELKNNIKKYQKILDEKVDAAEKLGTYYKLIGLKYIDYEMYRLALDAFENALDIYPENPNVLYYAALTSGRLSKTKGNESESQNLLNQAVRYYKASITFNNRFSSPMYGLAVIYIHELDQPELAIPLLELYNSIQKSSMNGMFLLSAAYFAIGNKNEAVDIYNKIIEKSSNENEIESARENRNQILRGDSNG